MSIRLSWTRYQAYDQCKLQYHLRYARHIRRGKPRLIFLVGSVVHHVVKSWADSGFKAQFVENAVIGAYNLESKGIKFASDASRLENLKKAVRGALQTERIYKILKFPENKADVEKDFDIPFPSTVQDRLIGGVDVYDPSEEGKVYDLKTYSDRFSGDRRQLMTYVVAMREEGLPVKKMGFITPFLKPKLRIENISDEEVDKHQATLSSALDDMRSGVDPIATTGNHCFLCEFNRTSMCPATYRSSDKLAVRAKVLR